MLVDLGQKVRRAFAGAGADHEGQMLETPAVEGNDHRAVAGNHRDLAVLLPEGEGLALDDVDAKLARIELEDGGLGDPRIAAQPVAAALASRNRSEVRPVTPASSIASSRDTLIATGEGHRGDAESGRAGQFVAPVGQVARTVSTWPPSTVA